MRGKRYLVVVLAVLLTGMPACVGSDTSFPWESFMPLLQFHAPNEGYKTSRKAPRPLAWKLIMLGLFLRSVPFGAFGFVMFMECGKVRLQVGVYDAAKEWFAQVMAANICLTDGAGQITLGASCQN